MTLQTHLFSLLNQSAAQTARPGFWPLALTIAGCVFILLTGVILSAVLIAWLYRRHRQALTVEKWLQVQNEGNTRSIFHLRPDAGDLPVTPALVHEGRQLAAAMIPVPVPAVPVPHAAAPKAAATPAAAQGNGGSPEQPAGKSSPKKSSEAANTAKQAKKEAMGAVAVGRKAGGILGALGSLLPGDLGKSLKEQSAQIQTTTQKASKAIETPEEKKMRLEHIQKEVKGLSGKKAQPSQAATPAQSAPVEPVEPTDDTAPAGAAAATANTSAAPRPQPRWIVEKGAFQTPALEPGQSMRIKLALKPVNIYRSVTVPLYLRSKQMAETAPEELHMVNSSEAYQLIAVPGLPASKAVLNILLSVLITAVNAYWVIVLIKWFIGVVI